MEVPRGSLFDHLSPTIPVLGSEAKRKGQCAVIRDPVALDFKDASGGLAGALVRSRRMNGNLYTMGNLVLYESGRETCILSCDLPVSHASNAAARLL
jgi:hypothetical protein